jgi:site-specific recombinase XerD
MDIDDLLHRFQSHLVATGKSPHTIRAYARDLRQYRSHLLTVRGGKGNKFRTVPLDRVAQLRGHESVDTTRIYATPSE